MNIANKIGQVAHSGVLIADDPEEWSGFLEPDCAAAVWNRPTLPDIQRWINGLNAAHLPHGRIVLHRATVRDAVMTLWDNAGPSNSAERDWLINDVVSLADRFAEMMKVSYLRLRLETVKTNACRKFHVDAITARLVCTYRGTGTQYGTTSGNADPVQIETTPTGAPILLRGTLWPPMPATVLKHRSPPIEGTGEVRLVLVLDPVQDPEEDV